MAQWVKGLALSLQEPGCGQKRDTRENEFKKIVLIKKETTDICNHNVENKMTEARRHKIFTVGPHLNEIPEPTQL